MSASLCRQQPFYDWCKQKKGKHEENWKREGKLRQGIIGDGGEGRERAGIEWRGGIIGGLRGPGRDGMALREPFSVF